ncbi:hypothetical protein [Brunnivagina elsteri]|uniref:Uncharacterized protein n=1 Tax=Brunnivagina elsteri CCALA 953 TaxID=987040 RepID=A0A2A2TDH9_9CYAN|nr:hypothetical protein [Calothrix elsteri]PAX51792.1 hypothetical protein CK510_22875 [Calothrix elsteri CCALA 953]
MLQTISKFNKLPLAAFILVSATTFNSPKVDAVSSQNIAQLPTSNTITAAPAWKIFSPDEGKSSVLMPNEEIVDIAPEPGEIHEGVKSTKMYLSTHEGNVFLIGYADFKSDVTQVPSSELLDSAVEGMLEGKKKLLSQKNITLDAYSGREIQIQDETDGITLTGRVFIVNQRMYMLLVGGDKNPQVSVRKFFNSFQLIN